MAHFAYPPGTPTGVISYGYVVPSTDWSYVVSSLFKSINGDEGGTWAPSAFLTIGGSGLQLTGTAHSIAASARVSVASTGEIRVLSGGSMSIRSGGAFDVYGAASLKSGGNLTAESGSTLTLSSGATITAASGSTTNLSGTTLVRGAMTIRASGGPGTLNVETGCTTTFEAGSLLNVYTSLAKVQSAGQVSWLNGSFLVSEVSASAAWLGSWTFGAASSVTFTAGATMSGTLACSARLARRAIVTLSSSSDVDITVADGDTFAIPAILSSNRQYTLRHTGTVPVVGERMRIYRLSQTTPSAHTAKIMREDSTIIFSFYVSREGFADFEYTSGGWVVTGGAQYASGATSGYYDDVW